MTKTINATKGELVTIINGLFGVQELKGKDFSLVVSKNISTLKDKLKDLEDAGAPDPKFLEVAQKVNEIANKNEPDARRDQMAKVEEMMKEKVKVKLDIISEEVLPEDISAAQINKIIKIIK